MDDDEYDFRYNIGIGQISETFTKSDQVQVVDCMCKHYSILAIKAELDQILCGLSSTLNMLYLIREHPKKFLPLFVYSPVKNMCGDKLYGLFKAVLSPDGSNRREEEELVLMWWADLIYHIEGTYVLEQTTSSLFIICFSLPRVQGTSENHFSSWLKGRVSVISGRYTYICHRIISSSAHWFHS